MSLLKAMAAERLLKWFFDRALPAISKKIKQRRKNGTTEENEKGSIEEGCD